MVSWSSHLNMRMMFLAKESQMPTTVLVATNVQWRKFEKLKLVTGIQQGRIFSRSRCKTGLLPTKIGIANWDREPYNTDFCAGRLCPV
jgi:hypothetical protein